MYCNQTFRFVGHIEMDDPKDFYTIEFKEDKTIYTLHDCCGTYTREFEDEAEALDFEEELESDGYEWREE